MIQQRTRLIVTDNSGAKVARCIQVLGGSKRRVHGKVGDVVVVSIISVTPNSKVKKGKVLRAVIVRSKSPIYRKDSSVVEFDDNSIVLIDKDKEPIGSRVFGPVSREVRQGGFVRIASLASELI